MRQPLAPLDVIRGDHGAANAADAEASGRENGLHPDFVFLGQTRPCLRLRSRFLVCLDLSSSELERCLLCGTQQLIHSSPSFLGMGGPYPRTPFAAGRPIDEGRKVCSTLEGTRNNLPLAIYLVIFMEGTLFQHPRMAIGAPGTNFACSSPFFSLPPRSHDREKTLERHSRIRVCCRKHLQYKPTPTPSPGEIGVYSTHNL